MAQEHLRGLAVLLIAFLAGCGPSQAPARSAGERAPQPAAAKRITAAVMGEPNILEGARDQGSTQAWNAHEWELRTPS